MRSLKLPPTFLLYLDRRVKTLNKFNSYLPEPRSLLQGRPSGALYKQLNRLWFRKSLAGIAALLVLGACEFNQAPEENANTSDSQTLSQSTQEGLEELNLGSNWLLTASGLGQIDTTVTNEEILSPTTYTSNTASSLKKSSAPTTTPVIWSLDSSTQSQGYGIAVRIYKTPAYEKIDSFWVRWDEKIYDGITGNENIQKIAHYSNLANTTFKHTLLQDADGDGLISQHHSSQPGIVMLKHTEQGPIRSVELNALTRVRTSGEQGLLLSLQGKETLANRRIQTLELKNSRGDSILASGDTATLTLKTIGQAQGDSLRGSEIKIVYIHPEVNGKLRNQQILAVHAAKDFFWGPRQRLEFHLVAKAPFTSGSKPTNANLSIMLTFKNSNTHTFEGTLEGVMVKGTYTGPKGNTRDIEFSLN